MGRGELLGKRLLRATHQGECLRAADLTTKAQILFVPGKDIMSIPLSPPRGSGYVGLGSRVDLIASYVDGTERQVFTLLPDMHVLAVNGVQDLDQKPLFPDQSMVSFAVDHKQALLITLANQRNCNLEVLLRHPDSPKREFDYDKTLARLKELGKQRDPDRVAAPAPRPVGR